MNVLLVFTLICMKILRVLTRPIFFLLNYNKKYSITPPRHRLLHISATDLAELIRERKVSCEQIVNIYIDRIREVNKIVNAVVEDRFDEALKDAKQKDEFLKTTNLSNTELEKIKPLLGVPVTIKESCSLAGCSYSVGSLNRRGIKAEKDGDGVSKVIASGAIPIAVTNTPEMCTDWEANNFITGRTLNPYNTTYTSGGSSGGEGALLGAGASVIGVGSDLAGSIRVPALFCGVYGHKPTAKIISVKGHFPLPGDENIYDYLVVGPLVRYAKDLKLMCQIMCCKNDIASSFTEKVDLSKLNVYFMEECGKSYLFSPVDVNIKKAIRQAVEHLEHNCKAIVKQTLNLEEFDESGELSFAIVTGMKDLPNILKGENNGLIFELMKSVVGQSRITFNLLMTYLLIDVMKTWTTKEHYVAHAVLRQKFIDKLGDNGIFLYPTFPTSAFKHCDLFSKMLGVHYAAIFNTMGLPSTNIPCGIGAHGLPFGFQVVAAPNQDKLCFAVAEELEKCFGGWRFR